MSEAPAPQDGLGPTKDERVLALIAHGLTFVEGGIIGPAILYYVKKDQSQFVAFHALQSVIFGLFAAVIIIPVSILTCGLGVILVVPYLIFEFIACLKAYDGEWYELPFAGPMAMKTHHP